jgi:DNA-binding response OmpR family regulator
MAKVIVVDDAYPELKLMESILRSAGLEIVCLPDGDQLEERMVEEQLDVLPLDIVMPNRNGYEIHRSLKGDSRTKHIRVVLVSSKNGESHRVWGKRQCEGEYLGKPFTAEQLVAVVRQSRPQARVRRGCALPSWPTRCESSRSAQPRRPRTSRS